MAHPFSFRVLRGVAAGLILLALPGLARAQVDALFHPASRQTVERARAILGLDAKQSASLDEAYAKYRATYKSTIEELRAKGGALVEKGRNSGKLDQAEREIGVLTKAAVGSLDALDAALLTQVKGLLTPEQAPRMAALERARRRETLKTVRVYGGDTVDLIAILDAQGIAWRADARVAPLVEGYDAALDPLASARDALVREMLDPTDKKLGPESLSRLYASSATLRECNRQHAKSIAGALPEASRADFQGEVLRRSYPRTFAPSNFDRALAAARVMTDLSDAQKGKVEALGRDYERDAKLANIALAQAIDHVHDLLSASPEKMLTSRDVDTSGVTKPREARRDLDKKFQARLEEILGKDRRLPPPIPPSRGGDFEPSWDDEGLKVWMEEAK